jgi:hypothetical protein
MKNVNELIALGKVPSDTRAADNQAGYPNGWPIFSDLSKQVRFDWDNLPSDRVRGLKNDPAYKAALEGFLLEGAAVTDAAAEIPTAAAAVSPEDQIVNPPVVEPTVSAEPTTTEEVTVPEVVVSAEEEGTKIDYPFGSIEKVKGGWEARVDNKDGSGVQVYKAKTKDELIGRLMQAQAHASQKIRQQEDEKRKLMLEEPADIARVRPAIKPRQLTADEQFEYSEAMSSGDPTRQYKAQEKYNAIRNGGTPEEIAGRLAEAENALQFAAYTNTAKAFMKQNADVKFDKVLGDKIDAILAENTWDYTVRNLNKVLLMLKEQNEVEFKVSTPVTEEVELPVPASAAATTVPVAVVPARVPPASTPQAATRLRPGSASTGASPRQASVRQGQSPVTPVGLTAEEYNRMSVSETKHKYKTDAGFAKAVQKLIDEGKI